MTASGRCDTCNEITGRYISQLKLWRCYSHSPQPSEAEIKQKILEEAEERMMRKKPKSQNKSPFGKRYFK